MEKNVSRTLRSDTEFAPKGRQRFSAGNISQSDLEFQRDDPALNFQSDAFTSIASVIQSCAGAPFVVRVAVARNPLEPISTS
jgi:hypothetical protein